MRARPWLIPSLVVCLALIVRLAVVAADGGYDPGEDAGDYDRHARSIAAGEGFPESDFARSGGPTALRPPAYPYVLGAVYALTGDSIEAGRLLNVALGGLAVFLLYLIAVSIWGRRVALVAAALAAVFPPLVMLSRDLLSESLFLVLMLSAVLCVLAFRRSGLLRWAAAAGAVCGLAALTRNPGIALVVPMALGVWMLRQRLSARALAAPALLLACTALVIAPWTIRNAQFGRFVPITSSIGFALAGTYNQVSLDDDEHPGAFRTPVVVPEYQPLYETGGVDEATLDATLRREALEFVWDHPAYVAEVTGHNLLRLFDLKGDSVVGARNVGMGVLVPDPDVVVDDRGIGSATTLLERIGLFLAAPFALLGAVAIVRSRRGAERTEAGLPRFPLGPWFLWLVPVVMILVAAPVNGLPRYRVPADPFLLLLAAIGIVWAARRLGAWRSRTSRSGTGRGGPRAAGATLVVMAMIALAGCGGDDDGEENAATTTELSPAERAAAEAEKQAYIAKVDAICHRGLREAKAIGQRFTLKGTTFDEAVAEQLIKPGVPLAERAAREIEAVQPRPEDPDLEHFIELGQPGLELLYQLRDAALAGDLTETQRLQQLLLVHGREQGLAARRFGLRECDRDYASAMFAAASFNN